MKPCPFCGSDVIVQRPYDDYMICGNCNAFGPDKDEDGEKWNNRAFTEDFGVPDMSRLPDICREQAELFNEGSAVEVTLRVAADEIERLRLTVDILSKHMLSEL